MKIDDQIERTRARAQSRYAELRRKGASSAQARVAKNLSNETIKRELGIEMEEKS